MCHEPFVLASETSISPFPRCFMSLTLLISYLFTLWISFLSPFCTFYQRVDSEKKNKKKKLLVQMFIKNCKPPPPCIPTACCGRWTSPGCFFIRAFYSFSGRTSCCSSSMLSSNWSAGIVLENLFVFRRTSCSHSCHSERCGGPCRTHTYIYKYIQPLCHWAACWWLRQPLGFYSQVLFVLDHSLFLYEQLTKLYSELLPHVVPPQLLWSF